MRIISIDPGYDRAGIAILEEVNSKPNLIYSECFQTDKKDHVNQRIYKVVREVHNLIEKFKPDIFAIENLFLNSNQKTAMRVSETRGALIYEANLMGVRIFEFTPLEIKIAVTGHGRSDKKQVEDMVRRIILKGSKDVLDDEMDAIAIGLTCLAQIPLIKQKDKLSTK